MATYGFGTSVGALAAQKDYESRHPVVDPKPKIDPFTGRPIAPGGAGATPGFDLNPTPRPGQGPFGLVPGPIGLPPVYNDVAGVFPNLSGNVAGASRNIANELAGELDPQTIAMLQNTSAQYGIGAGVPLSPFVGAQGLRHLGLTTEGQRAKGIEHLAGTLPAIANTLTVNPALQAEIASRNATLGAAPDPAAAAAEAERRFNQYLANLTNLGGGGVGNAGRNNPYAGWGSNYRDPFAGTRNSPAAGTGKFDTGGTTTSRAGPALGNWNLQQDYSPLGGAVATPGGGGFNDWYNDPFLGGGGSGTGLGSGGNFDWGAPAAPQDTGYWDDWFGFDEGADNGGYPEFPEWE